MKIHYKRKIVEDIKVFLKKKIKLQYGCEGYKNVPGDEK